jgi:hypothetical protein
MTREISFMVILFLISMSISFSGCIQPTQTIPPTITPTPTTISPAIPEPTHTPIPESTLRPTELAYTISVLDPTERTIHVRLEINNLHGSQPLLTFWTNARKWFGDWLDPWTNTANIQAKDNAGNSLPVSIVDDGIPWTGDGLRIDAPAEINLTVEYDVILGFVDLNFKGDRQRLVAGYMNKLFAVAEPEFLLLAPVDVETADYVMTLKFDIPEDQVSISHWKSLTEHSYSIGAADKAFSYGAIAFGQILSQEQKIGETDVRVAAYGVDHATFEKIADRTLRLYQYYETAIGATPIPGFAVIYLPEVTDNRYVNIYNEESGGFFVRYLPWYDAYWSDSIAHPIAHNWIGGGMQGEFWFQEGFTNYYELKSCEVIGLCSHSFVQKELADRFTQYRTQAVGTENDLSLVEAANRYKQDHGFPYDFITYEKGSLLAYLLDLRIAQLSGGERSLDDAMAMLWSRYGPGTQQHSIGVSEMQWAVEEVTGRDFTSFFDSYVRGIEPLPLAIRQKEVVLNEDLVL